MLEPIRKHAQGWLAKLILVAITVPFALWGVESYFQADPRGNVVATAGDIKIYEQEVADGVKEEQTRLREQLGAAFEDAKLDDAQMRERVINSLLEQKLVQQAIADAKLVMPETQLAAEIAAVPVFQENGQFSVKRYEEALQQRGLKKNEFEQRVRSELLSRQLISPYAQGAFMPRQVVERVLRANEQQREIALYALQAEQFMDKAEVTPAAVRADYDQNRSRYAMPEQVRLQYLVLSPATLAGQITVTDADIAAYYQKNAAQFGEPEQRSASHILIAVDAATTPAQQAAAEARAKAVLAEAQKNPAGFAELAKKNSQDPGSAPNGGELGSFPRGAMVKPFEDAVFAMKEGEIRGPVKSDFGYHIIKLGKITPAQSQPLEAVKEQVKQLVLQQKGLERFNEVAEQFGNLVFEQSDSLKPAADAMHLQISESAFIARDNQDPLLSSRKLMDMVFSDDVLKNGRNSEAVEVAPNTLVAARLIQRKPAGVRPFDEVKDSIAQRLRFEGALRLAEAEGKALLARLQKGETVDVKWGQADLATRQQGPWPNRVKEQAFRVDATHLPAYVGVQDGRAFYLAQVSRVENVSSIPADKLKMYQDGLAELLGNQATVAYVDSLKQASKLEVRQKSAETTAGQGEK